MPWKIYGPRAIFESLWFEHGQGDAGARCERWKKTTFSSKSFCPREAVTWDDIHITTADNLWLSWELWLKYHNYHEWTGVTMHFHAWIYIYIYENKLLLNKCWGYYLPVWFTMVVLEMMNWHAPPALIIIILLTRWNTQIKHTVEPFQWLNL